MTEEIKTSSSAPLPPCNEEASSSSSSSAATAKEAEEKKGKAKAEEAAAAAAAESTAMDTSTTTTTTTTTATTGTKDDDDDDNGEKPMDGIDEDTNTNTNTNTNETKNDKRKVILEKTDENNKDKHNKKRKVDAPPAPTQSKSSNNNTTPPPPPPSKKSKKQKRKNIPPAVLETRRSVQQCCATNNLPLALSIYQKALKENVKIEAQTFYNLLNLCDGLGGRSVHVGTPEQRPPREDGNNKKKKKEEDDRKEDSVVQENNNNNNNKEEEEEEETLTLAERSNQAFQIKSYMDTNSIPLNETAYTALIRLLSKSYDFTKALEILTQAESCNQCKPKLRLYSPLLQAYCATGDVSGALQIWSRLYQVGLKDADGSGGGEEKMKVTEREYKYLMECAIQTHNVELMERVLSDLAEDVLVPGVETTNVIMEWFEKENEWIQKKKEEKKKGHDNDGGDDAKEKEKQKESSSSNSSSSSSSSIFEGVVLPPNIAPSMGPITLPSSSSYKWTISNSCTVNTTTGELTSGCLSNQKLQPVELSNQAWNDMLAMNERIVLEGSLEEHKSQFQGGGRGKKRFNKNGGGNSKDDALERRKQLWEGFKRFLKHHVDENNSLHDDDNDDDNNNDEAKKQTTTTTTEKEAKNDLVVNHNGYDVVVDGANVGYYATNFANAPKHVDYAQINWLLHHFVEQCSKKVLLILHERHFSPRLMPHWAKKIVQGWNDHKDILLYKTPFGCNDDWFWMHAALIQKGTMVVTNDEMRDHHFQMLAHRSFLRWKERHRITFTFGEWDRCTRRRVVELMFPEKYSRRIQRLGGGGGGLEGDVGDCDRVVEEKGDEKNVVRKERNDGGLVIPLPKWGDEDRFADGAHVAKDESTPKEETYVCIQMTCCDEHT